jgi:hypothetical protein
VWLKLVRDGDVISSYSRKATTDFWTLIDRQTLTGLRPTVMAGLAVTSHHDGVLATAIFSSLDHAPLSRWTAQTIGASSGSATNDGAIFTLNGGGADIWNTADAFEFLSAPSPGDAVMTARVRSVENTHAWAKAGVMFRASLAAASRQVDLFVSPGKGVAMQVRTADGGESANVALLPGVAPEWVRLTRRGDAIAGSVSKDGATWLPVGSVSLAFGGSGYAGLAVTSHNPATEATAVFDDVALTP